MFDHMNFQFGCAGKTFIAELTSFWQFTGVRSTMNRQMGNVFVRFIAHRALVWPWIRVPLDVQTKRPLMNELLTANVAREIAFFGVDDDVMVEQ